MNRGTEGEREHDAAGMSVEGRETVADFRDDAKQESARSSDSAGKAGNGSLMRPVQGQEQYEYERQIQAADRSDVCAAVGEVGRDGGRDQADQADRKDAEEPIEEDDKYPSHLVVGDFTDNQSRTCGVCSERRREKQVGRRVCKAIPKVVPLAEFRDPSGFARITRSSFLVDGSVEDAPAEAQPTVSPSAMPSATTRSGTSASRLATARMSIHTNASETTRAAANSRAIDFTRGLEFRRECSSAVGGEPRVEADGCIRPEFQFRRAWLRQRK